jgi:hypothetical protein
MQAGKVPAANKVETGTKELVVILDLEGKLTME